MNTLRRLIVAMGLCALILSSLFPPRKERNADDPAPRGFLFSPYIYKAGYTEWDVREHPEPGVIRRFSYHYKAAEIDTGRMLAEWALICAGTGLVVAVLSLFKPNSQARIPLEQAKNGAQSERDAELEHGDLPRG